MSRHQAPGAAAAAALCLAFALAAAPVAAAKTGPTVGVVQLSHSGFSVAPLVSYDALLVTVTGPAGVQLRREFTGGQSPYIAVGEGGPWPDGQYRYELRPSPRVDASVRDAQRAAREAEGTGSEGPALVAAGLVQSGGFQVQDGSIVPPSSAPEAGAGQPAFLIAENLYTQGEACIGADCVDGEGLGSDTVRLKANNTRIKFDDTSSAPGFAANDWQLTANDGASGGLNKFSIDDITGGRTPFTIEAGNNTNAIYVDSTARVGFRTVTPVLDLHVNTSNTPALRLEQNNSGGFTAQTWDIGSNEANFFVRDVTGGSLLSFRIRPGAPSSSLDIASDGDVGVGTGSPDASLEVTRSNGTTQLLINETSATPQTRRLLDMQNNGGVRMRLSDNSTGTTWAYQNIASEFLIDANGGANEFLLTTSGNLTISGTLSQNSDRNLKTAIEPVDGRALLETLDRLPVATWAYKADKVPARHLGPMAQDFAAAFGLGADEKRLAPGDVAGVALAAIQALHVKVKELEAELTALRAQGSAQAARLAALEAASGNVRLQEVHQVLDGDRLVEHADAHP